MTGGATAKKKKIDDYYQATDECHFGVQRLVLTDEN